MNIFIKLLNEGKCLTKNKKNLRTAFLFKNNLGMQMVFTHMT